MSARTDLVARLPWVTRLEMTQDCDGYRYSAMSFKALRNPELRAKYKCRARARWRFRALARRSRTEISATSGTYCWSHLWALGLQHDMAEYARTQRGLAKMVSTDEWSALLSASSGRAVKS